MIGSHKELKTKKSLTQASGARFLRLFVGLLFSLVLVQTSYAANICQDVFSDISFSYPAIVQKIQPNQPHTIENVQQYLRTKLGAEALLEANNPKVNYVVVQGPAADPLRYLNKANIQSTTELSNPFGAFNVTKVVYKSGEISFAITNVNGESRYIQVLSFLRLANIPESRISTQGALVSYTGLYKNTFQKIGHVPDLVIFGFANTSFEAIVKMVNSPQAVNYLRTNKSYADRKWEKPAFDQHELLNMGVQVISFKNGKKIWLIDNEYGDRATMLIDALQDHGARNILLLGTAGSLNEKYGVGQVVSPRYYVSESGQVTDTNMVSAVQTKQGRHVHVDSPGLETKLWMTEQVLRKVDFVDVELQKASSAIRPQVYFDAYLIISDVINSSKPQDYTKWSESDRNKTKDVLGPILDSSLRRLNILNTNEIVSYDIKYFETAEGGKAP